MNRINNYLYCVFLLIVSALLINCSSENEIRLKKESNSQLEIEKIINEKLGENYKQFYNSDSTYVLAKSISSNKNEISSKTVKYIVVKLDSKEIVTLDSITRGDVKWYNKYYLEIQTTPGIVKGNEENTNFNMYFDVIRKKKTDKPSEVFLDK